MISYKKERKIIILGFAIKEFRGFKALLFVDKLEPYEANKFYLNLFYLYII